MRMEIKMDPREQKALRKLARELRRPDAVSRMSSGLVRSRANAMFESVQKALVVAGNRTLAQKLELVIAPGGEVGIALLPKRTKMGLSDFTESQAAWYIPTGGGGEGARVVSVASKFNPWVAKSLVYVPKTADGRLVVREVRPGEIRKLRARMDAAVSAVKAIMLEVGIRGASSYRGVVYVDVGFEGLRAEFGEDAGGSSSGVWRKAIREAMSGLGSGTVERIEEVLFDGQGWLLTTGTKSRKIESTELDLIRGQSLD